MAHPLQVLQTDYLDLYQMHAVTTPARPLSRVAALPSVAISNSATLTPTRLAEQADVEAILKPGGVLDVFKAARSAGDATRVTEIKR